MKKAPPPKTQPASNESQSETVLRLREGMGVLVGAADALETDADNVTGS